MRKEGAGERGPVVQGGVHRGCVAAQLPQLLIISYTSRQIHLLVRTQVIKPDIHPAYWYSATAVSLELPGPMLDPLHRLY
jgi:hypothetical protein